MKGEIECAGFIESSCDDGPGMRSVLFLQGCGRNCPGCQNASIRSHGEGTNVDIDNLVSYIGEKCCNRKLTISGGEPLEQAGELISLVKRLKESNFNICVYTGNDITDVPAELLRYLDYLKTGSFVEKILN